MSPSPKKVLQKLALKILQITPRGPDPYTVSGLVSSNTRDNPHDRSGFSPDLQLGKIRTHDKSAQQPC